jgi:methyl-accepting chemotaxis protein
MAEEVLQLGIDLEKIIREMKQLEDRFAKQFPKAIDEAEKSLDDFEKEMKKSTRDGQKQFDKLGRAAKKFGDDSEDAFEDASTGARKFGKQLDRLSKDVKRITSGIQTMAQKTAMLGKGLTSLKAIAGGVAAAWGIKEFVMFGATYERSIGKLRAVSGALPDEMLILRKAVRETGATTEFTASQAAEAAANLAAMGMPAKEVAGNLKLMVAASQALQAPIEDVSRIIKQQQNVFGLSTAKIANTLTGAYTTSAASVEKLDVALRLGW